MRKLRERYEATRKEFEEMKKQLHKMQVRMKEQQELVRTAESFFEDDGQGFQEGEGQGGI